MGERIEMRDKVVQEAVRFVVCDMCGHETPAEGGKALIHWAQVKHLVEYNYFHEFIICPACFGKLGLKKER